MPRAPRLVTPPETCACPKNDGKFRKYRADCQPAYNEWRDQENLAKELHPDILLSRSVRSGQIVPRAEHEKAKARFVNKFGPCNACKIRKVNCPKEHFPSAYEHIYQVSQADRAWLFSESQGASTQFKTQQVILPEKITELPASSLSLTKEGFTDSGDGTEPTITLPSPSSHEIFLTKVLTDSVHSTDDFRIFDSYPVDDVLTKEEFTDSAYNTEPLTALPTISLPIDSLGLTKEAFTDSGYGTERLITLPTTLVPRDDKEDTQTSYSDLSVDNFPQTNEYITALCGIIFETVRWTGDKMRWRSISQQLPHLIKAFALRLAACSSASVTRDTMFFIHKNHVDIAAHLTGSSADDDDEEQSVGTDVDQSAMTLFDKIDRWRRNFGIQDAPQDDELCQGVPDFDDSIGALPGFEKYRDLITSSDAFEWFVSMVKRQYLLASSNEEMKGSAMADISNKVLSFLGTGRVSRHRGPQVYHMVFYIPWLDRIQEVSERVVQDCVPKDAATRLHTTVGSLRHPQVLDCLTYARKVWPHGGEDILLAFIEATQQEVIGSAGKHRKGNGITELPGSGCPVILLIVSLGKAVTLRDRTKLCIQKSDDLIAVKASGLAPALALCAEQLAWLGATFHCTARTHPALYTPRIESHIVSQAAGSDINPELLARAAYIRFDVESLNYRQDSDQSQRLPVNLSMVNGYPRIQPPTSSELLSPHVFSSSIPSGADSSRLSDELTATPNQSIPVESTTQFTSPDPLTSIETTTSSSGVTSSDDLESGMFSLLDETDIAIPDSHDTASITILERVKISLAEEILRVYGHAPDTSSQGASYGTTTTASASANLGGPSVTSASSRTNSNKRTRQHHEQMKGDDQDSEDENEDKAPRSKKRKLARKNDRSLACPFWKLDPRRHRHCLFKQLTRPKDVKQHLIKEHAPDYFCDWCGLICRDQTGYNAHRRLPCEGNPGEVEAAAMAPAQKNAVMKKSTYKSTDESAWYDIWGCLFSGRQPPRSVYVSDRLLEYTNLVEAHCREHYQSALRQQIAAARPPFPPGSEPPPGFLECYLDFTVRGVFDTVFDSWRHQESQAAYPDHNRLPELRPGNELPDTLTFFDGTSGHTVQVEASTEAPLYAAPADTQAYTNLQDPQLHREWGNMPSFNNYPGLKGDETEQ